MAGGGQPSPICEFEIDSKRNSRDREEMRRTWDRRAGRASTQHRTQPQPSHATRDGTCVSVSTLMCVCAVRGAAPAGQVLKGCRGAVSSASRARCVDKAVKPPAVILIVLRVERRRDRYTLNSCTAVNAPRSASSLDVTRFLASCSSWPLLVRGPHWQESRHIAPSSTAPSPAECSS